MITIYVKKCLRPFIKDIATSKIRLGIGNLGNKGSCAIRFQYKDTTMAFCSNHLESGQGADLDVQRRQQMEKIIKTAFINERGINMGQYNWQSHDIKLMLGDMNFRYSELVEEEKLTKLIE